MIKVLPVFLFIFSIGNPSLFGKVNLSNTSGESIWPAIAVNNAGEIMLVWTEEPGAKMYYRINRGGNWTSMKNAQVVSIGLM